MIRVKARQKWNHHAPGKDMAEILPGMFISLDEGVAKALIRLKWAVAVKGAI